MATARLVHEWQDASGGFLRSGNFVLDTTDLTALEAAVVAVSNANLQYATLAVPFVSPTAATPGVTWYLCTDTAVLLFATGAGTTVQLVIPAPTQDIFKIDKLTVDPTSLLMVSLISEVVGNLCDSAGNTVTAFIQGVKSSRRTEQNAPGT